MGLKIAVCGDIMLGSEVAERMGTATVGDWLSGVSEAWSGADLLIGNLECPCVIGARPIDGPLPEIIFHASADRLAELAAAGFHAVTLANNHVLNCGPLGLVETIQNLDRVGIRHVGAGRNLAEAIRPVLISVRNLTIGLVAFCYGPPAGRSTPGVAPCEPKLMLKALTHARANSDVVIAALHDGLEYSDVPPSKTRGRFRFLAENGADIVIGHHPHVLQGLEWRDEVPIAYSLGDLLFHNSLEHVARRNFSRIAMGRYAPEEVQRDPHKFTRGAVLTMQISEGEKSIHWHPFRQDANLRPQLSFGDTRTEDLARLDELSLALLNLQDRRHALADRVVSLVLEGSRNNLGIREVLALARQPKWRYLPYGLEWLRGRLKRAVRAL
jgi:poly-gamma-glutamate synthesis protein (capsule biosynthesis protein)